MYIQKYSEKTERELFFRTRFGTWKANEFVEYIKDRIYVIPMLCFYFNSSELYIGMAWLNFELDFHLTDYKKRRDVYEQACRKRASAKAGVGEDNRQKTKFLRVMGNIHKLLSSMAS